MPQEVATAMTPTPPSSTPVSATNDAPSTATPSPTSGTSLSGIPLTITPVPLEAAEPRAGVVFWWSNIVRGYQLRFYPPAEAEAALPPAAPPPEMAQMPLIYLSRPEVEAAAMALARHFGVEIYEIEVPRLSGDAHDSLGG